jgi:hypothetical protein
MPYSISSSTQQLANFILTVVPVTSDGSTFTLGWYDSAGPQRASVYLSAPGYIDATTPNSFSRVRDFLGQFILATAQYNLSNNLALVSAHDVFREQIGIYAGVVRDYVAAGGGARWVGPFPQSVSSAWNQLVSTYLQVWLKARAAAQQVLAAAGATNANVSIPSITSTQPSVTPVKPVTALPPEAQAQILGTQRTVTPTALPGGTTATSPSNAPMNAVQTAVPAGAGLVIPTVPPAPGSGNAAGLPNIHTPLYKEPAFYVAIGATVLLAGIIYVQVRR